MRAPAWLLDGIFVGAMRSRTMGDAALAATGLYAITDLVLSAWAGGAAGVWPAFVAYYGCRDEAGTSKTSFGPRSGPPSWPTTDTGQSRNLKDLVRTEVWPAFVAYYGYRGITPGRPYPRLRREVDGATLEA